MSYRRYRNSGRGRDPYWLYVRYAGVCSVCGEPIPQGQRAFYYPNGRKLLCFRDGCGEAAAADFRAAAADEAAYAGGYGA